MADPFIGEIRMVGFNFAPRGWSFCRGQIISISQNTALFSLLGTVYGGNGQSTFGLPDFQSRSPVGMGQGAGQSLIEQGEMGGREEVTILSSQMPQHTHTATSGSATKINVAGVPSNASATPSATNNIVGASQAGGAPSAAIWSDALNSPVPMGNPISIDVTIGATGGSQPMEIRNPYLGINFIIAMEGLFPSRN